MSAVRSKSCRVVVFAIAAAVIALLTYVCPGRDLSCPDELCVLGCMETSKWCVVTGQNVAGWEYGEYNDLEVWVPIPIAQIGCTEHKLSDSYPQLPPYGDLYVRHYSQGCYNNCPNGPKPSPASALGYYVFDEGTARVPLKCAYGQ